MSILVAEFSAWNDLELTQAFSAAIKDVSSQGVITVVDRRHLDEGSSARVELAIRAADRAVASDQLCLDWLGELVTRQAADIRLAIGVALTNGATDSDAISIFNALGFPPAGAWREVRPAHGVAELYDQIVRWLYHIIAGRPVPGQAADLAQDSVNTINENLPVSADDHPTPLLIRQKP